MSIRTNPMKAVPVLLKRVKATRTKFLQSGTDDSFDGKMEKLTRELTKIEDVFMRVKKNQDDLLDALHEVDAHLRNLDRNRLDNDMDAICTRITDCAHKLVPMDDFDEDHRSSEIVESSSHDPSSSKHNNNQLLLPQPVNLIWDELTRIQQYCLASLSIFPKDAVIKKRLAIYLWIGRRIGHSEEDGEEMIDELLKLNVIVPYGNAKCPIVNKFQIHPRIRPQLYSSDEAESHRKHSFVLRQRNVTIRLEPKPNYYYTVFNASSSYLNFESQWLGKKLFLYVLQLGRWQDSPSHHIEVANQDFLNNLRHQWALSYLSLRGISRVFELPPSITQLERLKVLDLKACHNLETLPDDISSLVDLTHLILSQCYLLDSMPKGIDKLYNLQAVPVLLKRVKATRTKFLQTGTDDSFNAKMDMLTRVLTKIEDVFMRVKQNQDELLDALHEVDAHLRNLDRKRLDNDMDVICTRISDCAHKLVPMDDFDEDQIVHSHNPSSSKHNNNQLRLPQTGGDLTWDELRSELKNCLLFLSFFPKDAVVKKRQAIFLWIGIRHIGRIGEKIEEKEGEELIDELFRLNLLVPYGNGKCPIVNKFQIHPRIRPHLDSFVTERFYRECCLVLRQRIITISLNYAPMYLFNASSSYLNFEPQSVGNERHFTMLQLGRWQDSPSHHIEVGNQDFLNNLSNQWQLKYFSLRGISRVFELPPSIIQLENLQILDLKACHNLETLPDDISSLKNLTHLILSQCYLLDAMPKGIDKLHKLQVLKGFLLGNSRKTPCKISDLAAELKNLRRFSIHIGREAVIEDGEFESLQELSKLKHLKISWGVFDKRYSEIQINLPSSLKKLHLQGFPGQKIPEWLKPSKVPWGLKELNITGGKLESMKHDQDTNQWGMEIVRVKYLKHLEIDITHLQMLFPLLRYALIKPIPYQSYTEWSNSERFASNSIEPVPYGSFTEWSSGESN